MLQVWVLTLAFLRWNKRDQIYAPALKKNTSKNGFQDIEHEAMKDSVSHFSVLPEKWETKEWAQCFLPRVSGLQGRDRELRSLADSQTNETAERVERPRQPEVMDRVQRAVSCTEREPQRSGEGTPLGKNPGAKRPKRGWQLRITSKVYLGTLPTEAGSRWLKIVELRTQKGWDLLYTAEWPILIQVAYRHVESAF